MRTIVSLCAALAALTFLVGCSGGSSASYVGKWDMTMTSSDPEMAKLFGQAGTIKNALELKADNTYNMDIMGNKMEGTYKVDGKTLTMTPKEGGKVGILTASDDGNTLTGTEDKLTMKLTRSKG